MGTGKNVTKMLRKCQVNVIKHKKPKNSEM